jgi:hypothetical protein
MQTSETIIYYIASLLIAFTMRCIMILQQDKMMMMNKIEIVK